MVPDRTSPVVHVGNILLVHTKSKQAPTPGRSLGDQRQTDPAITLGHLIPPPMRQPWSRGEKFCQVITQLHQLTGPINTSMRSIRSILTRGGQLIGR
jgi:hypothetical protein